MVGVTVNQARVREGSIQRGARKMDGLDRLSVGIHTGSPAAFVQPLNRSKMGRQMSRAGVIVATLAACTSSSSAQTALERGKYLVSTIMACGNCHTPKDASGAPILARELSGGLTFTIPPYNGVAANVTPDRETGIG